MTFRVGIDIGGVISKEPDRFRRFINVLLAGGAEVYIVTDMGSHLSPEEGTVKVKEVLQKNNIRYTGICIADFNQYGEACKAVAARLLNLDMMVDDFGPYVGGKCPISLLLTPDLTHPYYHDDWVQDEEGYDFGRKDRVLRYLSTMEAIEDKGSKDAT